MGARLVHSRRQRRARMCSFACPQGKPQGKPFMPAFTTRQEPYANAISARWQRAGDSDVACVGHDVEAAVTDTQALGRVSRLGWVNAGWGF